MTRWGLAINLEYEVFILGRIGLGTLGQTFKNFQESYGRFC